MDWKDLEKMTIVKLREEALKHQDQIKGVQPAAVGGTGVGKFELTSVTRRDSLPLPPAVEDSDFR